MYLIQYEDDSFTVTDECTDDLIESLNKGLLGSLRNIINIEDNKHPKVYDRGVWIEVKRN